MIHQCLDLHNLNGPLMSVIFVRSVGAFLKFASLTYAPLYLLEA